MNIGVIIPAYNESKTIKEVIESVQKEVVQEIIVVDDGSNDKTAQIGKECGVTVISHEINLGAGAAMQTGIIYARKRHFDCIVFIDADGQHDSKDITDLIDPIKSDGCDIVNGSRFLSKKSKSMPFLRFCILWVSKWINFIVTGKYVTDPFIGLKAFSKKAYFLINIKENRYAWPFDVFFENFKNLILREVPVTVRYTGYSMNKGQSSLNSVNIVRRLVWKLLTK